MRPTIICTVAFEVRLTWFSMRRFGLTILALFFECLNDFDFGSYTDRSRAST